MTELERAVRRWVRAEYLFRCGPRAYGDQTTDWILEAEDNLRKVLTGHAETVAAYHSLGPESALTVRPRLQIRKRLNK